MVKVLTEFQGKKEKKQRKIPGGGEGFDEIPGSTVSKNGHPQQGEWTISGKAHFLKVQRLNLTVTFSC